MPQQYNYNYGNEVPYSVPFRTRKAGDLTYTSPFPKYIPLPLGELSEATKTLAEKYKTAKTQADITETALKNEKTIDKDNPYKQAAIDKYTGALKSFQEQGNWEYGYKPVTDATKAYLTDQGLNLSKKNYIEQQAYEEKVKARIGQPVEKGGLTQEQALSAIQMSRDTYKGVQYIDPKTRQVVDPNVAGGLHIGEYKGYNPADYADLNKLMETYGQGYMSDLAKAKNWEITTDANGKMIITKPSAIIGENGYKYETDSSREQVTYEEIQKGLTEIAKTDEGSRNWLESRFKLENYGSHPEYFDKEGNLNEEGTSAMENFKTGEYNQAIDRAANKFSFLKESKERDITTDDAYWENKKFEYKKAKDAAKEQADMVTISNVAQSEQLNGQDYSKQKEAITSLQKAKDDLKLRLKSATNPRVIAYINQELQDIDRSLQPLIQTQDYLNRDMKNKGIDIIAPIQQLIVTEPVLLKELNNKLRKQGHATINSIGDLKSLLGTKTEDAEIIKSFINKVETDAKNLYEGKDHTLDYATVEKSGTTAYGTFVNKLKDLYKTVAKKTEQYFEQNLDKNLQIGTDILYTNNKGATDSESTSITAKYLNVWKKTLNDTPTGFKSLEGLNSLHEFAADANKFLAKNDKGEFVTKTQPNLDKSELGFGVRPIGGKIYMNVLFKDDKGNELKWSDNNRTAQKYFSPDNQLQARNSLNEMGKEIATKATNVEDQKRGKQYVANANFAELTSVNPDLMQVGTTARATANMLNNAGTLDITYKVVDNVNGRNVFEVYNNKNTSSGKVTLNGRNTWANQDEFLLDLAETTGLLGN